MNSTLEYNKNMLRDIKKVLEKSNERKISLRRELAKDKFSLDGVDEWERAGDPIPEKSYNSFKEWREQLQKEISAGESALEKIAEQEMLVIAIDHYLATATD